jgi:hypothetical protein
MSQAPADGRQSQNLRDDIAAALSGMMYISESEAPLELMSWNEVRDLPGLQHAIEVRMRLPQPEQAVMPGEDLLARVRRMADPADPVMMDYVKQYEALFGLLRAYSQEIVVVRAGEVEVQLFIAAFGSAEPVVIHTTAIET